MIFAEKGAIQKILVEVDLPKAHTYDAFCDDPKFTTLLTETDKTKYKQAVWEMNLQARYGLTTRQRRLLSPAFSISYLNGLEPLFQGCVNVMMKVLNEQPKSTNGLVHVDIYRVRKFPSTTPLRFAICKGY